MQTPVRCRDQQFQRLADQFLPRIPEHFLGTPIQQSNAAFARHRDDGLGRGFEIRAGLGFSRQAFACDQVAGMLFRAPAGIDLLAQGLIDAGQLLPQHVIRSADGSILTATTAMHNESRPFSADDVSNRAGSAARPCQTRYIRVSEVPISVATNSHPNSSRYSKSRFRR